LGINTLGPTLVITDLCIMRPDPKTKELVVRSLHPGVTREQVTANTGWAVRFAETAETTAPTDAELTVLRNLQERTARAHEKSLT
jgi:glutaconate CoA-transferase subunit B